MIIIIVTAVETSNLTHKGDVYESIKLGAGDPILFEKKKENAIFAAAIGKSPFKYKRESYDRVCTDSDQF
jgi:hypothetical protein